MELIGLQGAGIAMELGMTTKHGCKGCWVCKDDVPDDYDGHADKGEPINYPLKFWDGDTERGGD